MTLPAPSQRLLSGLLAAPPALRHEIARTIFSSGHGAALAAKFRSAGVPNAARGYSRTHLKHIRRVPVTRRALATAPTETLSTPAPGSPPPPPSPPPLASEPLTPPTPPPRSRTRRFLTTAFLSLILFGTGFAMSAAPVAETINGFVNPPTDEESLSLFEPTFPSAEDTNSHIVNHPLAVKTRAQSGMMESRPHLKIPPAMRPHNLTGGVLLGEDKIAVPPLTFSERDAALPTFLMLAYLGPSLCGHPGIVHGGLLATLLDEGLARACFPALPNKVGVTASLKIDYRVPCPAGSYIVLRAHTTKVEGRKAWVKGWIELLGEEDGQGMKIVEAEALFIEPKGAKSMPRVYSSQ